MLRKRRNRQKVMKIRTPDYYKEFQCIAGACTDTCCAGWDVDVEERSYQYYKQVGGAFGKRLQSVMVPEEQGGCTFTLKEGRCPFLNDENLCDLFIALGEDKLCDTCAEFPRFINEYGSEREIGLAPSCKTAGELLFGYKGSLTFTLEESDEPVTSYNEIDPELYFKLRQARVTAYNIIRNRSISINERCMLYLDFAKKLQRKLDAARTYQMDYEIAAYADEAYLKKRLEVLHAKYHNNGDILQTLSRYFAPFPKMEVIHPDWFLCMERNTAFSNKYAEHAAYLQCMKEFDTYYQERQQEYEQLMMYYAYRYFLSAVHDEEILQKAKIGVIGFLVLKQLDLALWDSNGKSLSFTEQVDLAHLYSRQFEHSYTNFEIYNDFFRKKRIYSFQKLMECLNAGFQYNE